MAYKPYSTKLDDKTLKALKAVSERTRIPQSELVREGVEFVIRKHLEDALTPELRDQIEDLLKNDSGLLKRLSKA